MASSEFPPYGLVRDGTPCGEQLICINQTCVSLHPFIDQTRCPTNSNNLECYGQGVSKVINVCKITNLRNFFINFCFLLSCESFHISK